MGIVKTLKKSFNINGIEISISANKPVYSQNDEIAGKIVLRSGEYDLSGNSLKIELQEFWTETTGATAAGARITETKYKSHQEVQLSPKISIPPHSTESYPFRVRLPKNCRISTKTTIFGVSFNSGWCLKVTLDLPFAINPLEKMELKVEPAEEFLSIIQACESKLHFEEKLGNRRWNESTARMHFLLIPSEELKPIIKHIVIAVQQNEDKSVSGCLLIDLQQKSIINHLKKFFLGYHTKRAFKIGREQIYLSTGETNQKEIAETISTTIQQI